MRQCVPQILMLLFQTIYFYWSVGNVADARSDGVYFLLL